MTSWSRDEKYGLDAVWRGMSWEARLAWVADLLPEASRATVADIAACGGVAARDAFIAVYRDAVERGR